MAVRQSLLATSWRQPSRRVGFGTRALAAQLSVSSVMRSMAIDLQALVFDLCSWCGHRIADDEQSIPLEFRSSSTRASAPSWATRWSSALMVSKLMADGVTPLASPAAKHALPRVVERRIAFRVHARADHVERAAHARSGDVAEQVDLPAQHRSRERVLRGRPHRRGDRRSLQGALPARHLTHIRAGVPRRDPGCQDDRSGAGRSLSAGR